MILHQGVTWQAGKRNMPGLAGVIYAIPAEYVLNVNIDESKNEINDPIELAPETYFIPIYHTRGTGEVKFARQGERDNGSMKNSVGWNTPGNEPDNMMFANNALNGPWVFLAMDTKKEWRLLGDEFFSAYMVTADGTTGKAATDRRGYEYLFDVDYPVNPPLYKGGMEGLVLPAPLAETPTPIANTSLTAKWSAISGADAYLLDVSTSPDFTTYVSGYNGLEVSGVSQSVTGLTAGTTYYYRVRTKKGIFISGNSNVRSVTTTV